MNFCKIAIFWVFSVVFSPQILRGSDFFFESDSTRINQLLKSAKTKTHTHFKEAILDAQEAITVSLRANNPIYIFESYRRLGRVYEDNERHAEAADKYFKALEISYKISTTAQLDIMIDWAIINKKLGNYKISRDYYENALTIAFQVKDLEMVDFAYNGLGTLHAAVGEFDKALDAYLRSKSLSEERKDTGDIIKSLNNISEAYVKAKNYDLAIETSQQALSFSEIINDSNKICRVLNIQGKILTATGDYKSALKKHESALSLCENYQDKKLYINTLVLLADAHTQLNELTKAEDYLEKCLVLKELVNTYDLPNFYYKLGELYRLQNKSDKALDALKKSIELASVRRLQDVMQKAYDAMAKTYQQRQEFKLAFNYLALAKRFSDSLYNEESSKHLAEARYKFDVERSEKELQIANDKKLETVKWERSRFTIGLFVICFIIVIVVLSFFLRDKNRNNLKLQDKTYQISQQNKRLEKSNEILRQFAYASAHDLKEPLRSISSFVYIIHRKYSKLLPLEAEEYMSFVTNGVKRMESLLAALLEYSTVASEKHVVESTISLTQVLDDVVQNLHATIKEKDAQIKYPKGLPDVWISKHHLTQLCQNLISNSLKFSKRRPVIVITKSILNNEIVISFCDNGIGMKQEYSDKIYRLFQRLDRSAEYEGAGIGLAICKHIVDVYDGRIWFNSIENEGTTFHIAFPSDLLADDLKHELVKKEETLLEMLMKKD